MKRILLSLASRISLVVLSISVGMISYLVVQKLGAGEKDAVRSTLQSAPLSFYEDVVIDAEPFLLAKTESPVDFAGDALGVFYILQKNGDIIRVAPEVGGGTSATPYTSLGHFEIDPDLGFSSLALHPDFHLKEKPGYGRFYVIAAEKSGAGKADFLPEFGGGSEHHQDVLYEFTVADPLLLTFRGEKRELMRFSQPGAENNLCGLTFDPTGLLYLGVGDGASAEVGRKSPSRNASSLNNAFGKVLRIDPVGNDSLNGSYGIPEGNPFRLVTGSLPELWAFGLRAPHSLSFDPFRRSLCIGERSYPGAEEINFSQVGGEHFGWDIGADSARMNSTMRAQLAEIVTQPALAINLHSGMAARTTGSVVYRGECFPSLAGKTLFASHDGQIMALRSDLDSSTENKVSRVEIGRLGQERFRALRTSHCGELILLCEDGSVYEMRKGASLGTGGSSQRSLFCLVRGTEKFCWITAKPKTV